MSNIVEDLPISELPEKTRALKAEDLTIISLVEPTGKFTAKISLQDIIDLLRVVFGIEVGINVATMVNGKANASHNHYINDIVSLQDVLNSKANVSHNHTVSSITGLADALSNKAETSHMHAINGVSGLVDALAGKAATLHSHEIDDVNGLRDVLENLQTGELSAIEISDVIGLVVALGNKANTSHNHTVSNITNLQTLLNAKADNNAVTTALATKADTAFVNTELAKKINNAVINAGGGVLGLDANAEIPSAKLEKTQHVVLSNFDSGMIGRVEETDTIVEAISKLQNQVDIIRGVLSLDTIQTPSNLVATYNPS